MIYWFKYPFIRLLIPFVSGIYLAFLLNEIVLSEKNIIFLLVLSCILFLLMLSASILIRNYSFRWFFAIILNVFFFLIGFIYVNINDYKLENNGVLKNDASPKYYMSRLTECPTIKEKSVKVMMEIIRAEYDSSAIYDGNSKIIAYFEKTEESINLEYGDCILFLMRPENVDKPPNPEQFDYNDYLYKKGVTHQVYLKSDAWLRLNVNKANPIYGFSYWIRDFLLATMQKLGVNDEEYAVAAAILLGYDDVLPYDLRQKYVAAGAMHILCVSGLHVGVIFMVFSYMLVFLNDRKKTQRILKHLILLLLIWFYALLAGLAPSILRATIMLSFVIIGNIINRKGILLNSLAASAFILLCINPSNLFDIGFLLSYVAVIGIVVLQNPIKSMICSKYKIVNKIWEITSVTIAAQIATTPFTIYYFHQFPIYFWLSNLFMTPISSIVIIGGMIMLLVFFIPFLNEIVAFFVSKMIFVMNIGVSWIESLPNSIIKGLYIDDSQFLILLLTLLMLLLYVELKSRKLLLYILSMICIFLSINVRNLIVQCKQHQMIFYSVNNMTAIDFLCGRRHLLMADSIFFNDKSAFSYNIENFLVSKGVFYRGENRLLEDDFDHDFVKKKKNVVTFDEKIIGMSDGSVFYKEEIDYRIKLDYMFVYGQKQQSLTSLLYIYDFDYLIVDGSVPNYLASKLIEEADNLNVKHHYVKEEGALVID